MTTNKKILVILTSCNSLHPAGSQEPAANVPSMTGFDIKELAYIYSEFSRSDQNSIVIDIASNRGKTAPIDPMSIKASERDEIVQQFMRDPEAMRRIQQTVPLADVAPRAADYAAVLFVGGAGAIFDLPNNHHVSDIVSEVLKSTGIVAAIGHGLAALLNVRDPKTPQQPFLKNKRVTCNTVEEEREMELDKALPFLLEKKLKEIGARFEKQDKFKSNVVMDERLITGQNRNSAKEWVECVAANL